MSQGNSLHRAVSALAAFSVAVSSASPVLFGGASVAAISVVMASPAGAATCLTGLSKTFTEVAGISGEGDRVVVSYPASGEGQPKSGYVPVGPEPKFNQGAGGSDNVRYPNDKPSVLENGFIYYGGDAKLTKIVTAGDPVKVLKNVKGLDSGASADGPTSLGCGADATAAKGGTAVGGQAKAGLNSTALGFQATALGENSVALGKGATTGEANNAVAVGEGAQAQAYGAVALGNGAVANGAQSTAMGHNASTGEFTNAAAIGAGATATRDNQIMLGTASNTYTAPGITSAASKAAQKGPVQVVTTDRNGNLAADGGAMYDNISNINSSITNLNANVAGLWNNVSRLNGAMDRLKSGVAMSMALSGMYLPEHKNYAITANMGFYNNKQAIGINGMARLNETFVANGGIAFGVNGFGPEGNTDVGGRVGLTAAW